MRKADRLRERERGREGERGRIGMCVQGYFWVDRAMCVRGNMGVCARVFVCV